MNQDIIDRALLAGIAIGLVIGVSAGLVIGILI